MKKVISALALTAIFANAHFLTILPTSDNIEDKKDANIKIDAMFIHPFEQSGMNMEKPKGIFVNNSKNSLPLKETKKFEHKAWETSYSIDKPAVYKFFVQPEPYFEESEGLFISHVPKVIVSAFGEPRSA